MMTVQGSPLQQVLLSARCCNHSGSFLAQAYRCTVFYNTTSRSFDSYEQLAGPLRGSGEHMHRYQSVFSMVNIYCV